MKKKTVFGLTIILCFVGLYGCKGSVEQEESSDVYVNNIESFTFEEENYTFPLDYSVIEAAGWEVSDYSREMLEQDDVEMSSLTMDNERYPGLSMDLNVYNHLDEEVAFGSVEELIQELKDNGIWGVCIYAEDVTNSEIEYPDFSFKGISFGSTLEELKQAFGETESFAGRYNVTVKENDKTIDLSFEFRDDSVCSIYANVDTSSETE